MKRGERKATQCSRRILRAPYWGNEPDEEGTETGPTNLRRDRYHHIILSRKTGAGQSILSVF